MIAKVPEELESLHRSIARGTPFGDERCVQRTANRLGGRKAPDAKQRPPRKLSLGFSLQRSRVFP